MSRRGRTLAFLVLLGAAVAAAVGYVAWSALKTDAPAPVRPPSSELSLATARKPYLVYQHVARDAHYAEIAIAPVDQPGARPTFTGLVCERVYASGGQGICLIPKQEPLGSAVTARLFGLDFRPTRSARLDGIASRARVSPTGRYGAATTFVTGHSYKDAGFSTKTSLIDMGAGKVLADVEKFAVTKDGKAFKSIDFNFWGVTFARDDNRFYATLQTSGDIYLVEGDVEARTARVIAKDVECPSLSPDGTRIAYKLRTRRQLAPARARARERPQDATLRDAEHRRPGRVARRRAHRLRAPGRPVGCPGRRERSAAALPAGRALPRRRPLLSL